MIITAIKAAAVVAFVGITVGLMQLESDSHTQEEENLSQQVYSEHPDGVHQEN